MLATDRQIRYVRVQAFVMESESTWCSTLNHRLRLQHYAAHTLENVVTMGSDWARRFAEPAFVSNLISLWSVAKCAVGLLRVLGCVFAER